MKSPLQTPFLNLNVDPFQQWYGIENVAKVKINGESCMALLDNCAQVNTNTPRYIKEHSLQVGPITNLMGSKVTCMGLGNAYTRPLGYMVIQLQVDGVWGYDEDQIALVIPDFSNFATRVPIILGTTEHQWVSDLAKYSFWLEYQKGQDNAVADALSQVTTHLEPEAVQAVLDGATMGTSQRVERENPPIIKSDQQMEQEVQVATGQILVEMHVTDWAAAQKEDPELNAVLQWLESKKKADLKTLLRECMMREEGRMVWRKCQNFTSLRGTLYLHSTPKGENEDLLLFVVPKVHQTATLNGFHQDAGHQGCDHTLSLLQENFWWPGMAKQMRQVIKSCRHCLQYEGSTPKAPLCPIVATAPLDLLHVDFTSIETTLELNKSPRVANVLVFQDHFTKHVLAYVTSNHPAKTITKFLYGGYISLFGALARLLSDRGTSFTSSIIEELCKILGIQ